MSIAIAVPPRDEQDRIIATVQDETTSLRTAIDRAHREISLLREYRTGLIADVVTGKLDVRSAAANLPVEADLPDRQAGESEADGDTDALAEGDEDAADGDLVAAPEEAEA